VSIGIGMIGSGGMARVHAQAVADVGSAVARLVAVGGGTRAGQLAADFGAAAEPSVEALLERADVDAVVIATPHTTHLGLVGAAAAAHKHILLEKPMALDIAECDAMIEAAGAADVRLMVAHITRFLPATAIAKRLVEDGEIGSLRMISVHRILDGYPNEGWTLDPREGTAWLDWGSHGCDVVRWFAGFDPLRAFAQFTSYRRTPPANLSGMALVVFPGDVMSQIWMSYEVPADSWIQRARYVFTGSEGLLDLNAYGQVLVTHGRSAREAYTQPDLEASSREGVRPNTYFREGFAAQLLEFLGAVANGREPSVSGADARAAIEMVQAAEQSSTSGAAVAFPLTGARAGT
jgi:myo-inositol 2-dehydrogenase/D-chiro-inositol 1-dehydrogenase